MSILRAVAAVAVLLMSGLTLVAGPAAGQTPGQPPDAPAHIRLASQSTWLAPGDPLDLGLQIDGGGLTPDNLTIVVTICQRVSTRSEFALTLGDKPGCNQRQFIQPQPVSSLPLGVDGIPVLRVAVPDETREAGVYPVRVELRVRGGRKLDQFFTHIIAVGPPSTNLKLGVGLVLPVTAQTERATNPATATTTAGRLVLDPAGAARTAGLVAALTAHPAVPVTLRPAPPTLEALAGGSADQSAAVQALAADTRGVPSRQIVSGTYAPIDLAAVTADGLESELTAQVARADDVVSDTLQARPDPRTWVADDKLGHTSVSALSDRGVDRLVLPEASLAATPRDLTPTQPFVVEPEPGRRITAVAADDGLATHFAPTDDPVLEAHQLLADLAVIYFDAPGSTRPRGVAAVPPRSWQGDPAFVNVVLDGLLTSPLVAGVTLDNLFTVPLAVGRGRTPLVRTLSPTTVTSDRSLPANAIRSVRRRLEGFGSYLDRDNQTAADLFDDLDRSLLLAESSDLRARQRTDAVDAVDHRIDEQVRLVRLSNTKSIRLTARSGEIPVTVVSDAPYPVHVVIRLQSPKLVFPHGGDRSVDIVRHNTTSTFTVDARTSGAFPLFVNVESPTGRLLVATRHITVRSTAASHVGLLLSIGAGAFLLAWWARNFRHVRRARRLVTA